MSAGALDKEEQLWDWPWSSVLGSAWAACGSSRTLMCLTENLELDAGEEEVACWGGQGSAVSGGCGVQV